MSKLIFLGTGTSQGVPVIGSNHPVCLSKNEKDKRFRSSILFQLKNTNILIDCGPDFRMQMLQSNISQIEAILFTHEHNDHVLGLDDIRPIVFRQKREMPIYGQKRVIEEIKKRFPYVFETIKYFGVPGVQTNEISDSFFINGIRIDPIKVMHGNLPILGFKILNTAYITDANFIEKKEKEKLKNLDILVLNALRKEPIHYSHFTLDQALEIIDELKPKKAYLTHISHYMGFHEDTQKELPKNVFLAYDGLEVEL